MQHMQRDAAQTLEDLTQAVNLSHNAVWRRLKHLTRQSGFEGAGGASGYPEGSDRSYSFCFDLRARPRQRLSRSVFKGHRQPATVSIRI